MRHLASLLMLFGVLITSSAVLWWHSFYRVIAAQLVPSLDGSDPTLARAIKCLYSNEGICKLVIDTAHMLEKTVYTPALFWSGIILTACGLAVRYLSRVKTSAE